MKKSLLGSIFVAGIVLSGIAAQPQVHTHAAEETAAAATKAQADATTADATADQAANTDSQAPVKSQVPAGQTIKTDGQNDTISTADSEVGQDANGDLQYKHVGNGGVVQVTEGYDDDYNENGYYKASVANQNAFKDYDTQDDSGYDALGAETVLKGDTTYYAEYANGAWQANSLTMTDGKEPAGRQSFNVDVTSIAENNDGSYIDQTVADGVDVHISKTTHEDDGDHILPSGTTFSVSISGANAFDDNYQEQAESANDLSQLTDAFVNVPYTFHYFDTNNNLITGTLNLINGKIEAPDTDKDDTPTTTPDTDKDDTPTTTPDTDKDDTPTTTPDTDKDDTPTKTPDTDKNDTDKGTPAKEPAIDPTVGKTPAKQPATGAPKATPLAVQPAAKAQTPAAPAAKSTAKALPATGDQQTTLLAAFGTAMLALLGLTGLVSRKRHA